MAVKKAGAPIQGDTGAQGGGKMQPVYKSTKKAEPPVGGGEDEGSDADKEEDEEEQGNDMAAKAKKSMPISEDDLQKSLDKLGALATAGIPASRKDSLLKKAQTDELSKSEKSELFKLLGGEASEPETPALSKSIQETFTENEVLQKATDVSDYLDENQKALVKSLSILSDRIEAGDVRQHEFNLVLAKAVSGVGKLVKGMSERLGVIESQPTRAPKSRGIQASQVLHKGFGGNSPAEDALSHAQILDGLDGLMQKSMAEGKSGMSEGGENILTATAKFEQTRQITPGLLQEITRFHQGTRN